MAQTSENISIAIMGGTGTGKTTFTNFVSGSKFLVGNGLESCTNLIQTHEFSFNGHNVTLIDVPGFDDTSKSDADILKMIADFLAFEYKAGRRLSGIMYFHRISDVRMGGASRRNFIMFQKLCGEDAFTNVAIVTTRWDQEEEAVGNARLEELKNKSQLYKPILDGGGTIFRHERTQESANAILAHIIAKTTKPLLIQHEMVEDHKEVSETAAGKELQQEILRQVERHQKEMEELLEELKQTRDTSELEELEAECKALQEKAVHWQEEARKLSEPSSSSIANQGLEGTSSFPQAQAFHTTSTHNMPTDSSRDESVGWRTNVASYEIHDDCTDMLEANIEGTREKIEDAVKYLLNAVTKVLYKVDSLRRAAIGSRR